MQGDAHSSSELARTAVRALLAGRVKTVEEAIDLAVHSAPRGQRVQRPSRAMLRAHAQALEESESGQLARLLRIEAAMQEALAVLSTLEEAVIVHDRDGADMPPPQVYGRAARAEFDLDPSVHVRVTTALPASVLAQALADAGLGETEVATIATRYGNLDEIRFSGAHAEFRIVRVPPRADVDAELDLIRGKPVEHAAYEAFLRRMPQFGCD